MTGSTPGPVKPPNLLTIGDLARHARPDRRLELVDGHLFVSALETPYLDLVIASAERVIRAAAGPRSDVRTNEPITFDDHNLLVPDVAVRGDGELPRLVFEVRSDSTERYALGPKRMVYSRARIPEYWFFDPRAQLLAVFRSASADPDYPWPPAYYRPGEEVPAGILPPVRVADLAT